MATSYPKFLDAVDVKVVTPHYEVMEKLGEGSYGIVFKAANKQSGALVAIKKLRLDGMSEGVPATTIREITLLQELKHPFVVNLISVFSGRRRVYLVFELLAKDLRMTIVDLARNRQTLAFSTIKRYTKQMLTALWYSHNQRVVHRDLKPGNILVSEDGRCVKVADYGLARSFEMELTTYTHEVVTLWYRAPELLLGERHYTPAVDVFSVGCIMVEMVNGRPAFRGDSDMSQLQKYFQVLGTPTETSWPGVSQLRGHSASLPEWKGVPIKDLSPDLDPVGLDLLEKMLQLNPAKRPTVAECLSHPWLDGVGLE
jgi:serine/threonine protein kinase